MLRRVLAVVVVVALSAVAACANTPAPGPGPGHTGGPANGPWSEFAPADAATKTGPGTPCPRALAFDVPAGWKLTGDFTAAGGLTLGGLDLVCELDGKPAGVVGIMRVYRGDDQATDLSALGRRFLSDWAPGATEIEDRDATVGSAAGVEISYRSQDHYSRDFLVRTAGIVYLVDWGGFDEDEHQAGMPAYELARTSAQV